MRHTRKFTEACSPTENDAEPTTGTSTVTSKSSCSPSWTLPGRSGNMTGSIFNGAGHRRKLVHATAPTLGGSTTARRIRQIGNIFPRQGADAARGWRAALPE